MTKLFVWDFHGVLEKGNLAGAKYVTNKVLDEFGARRLTDEEYRGLYGLNWTLYFKKAAPESSDEIVEKMRLRAYRISAEEQVIKKHIQQMDYAPVVLDKIRAEGNLNILLSNSSPKSLVYFTDAVGLTDYFDHFIGVDRDDAKERKTKKQALEEFLDGKEFEKVIVIGDHPFDIMAGNSVNAITYLFSYDKIFPEVKANYKISDLREVLKEL